jgi:hypothetical protein
VTVVPVLVTVYVTMVPLQKWNFSVTGAPSLISAKNVEVNAIVLAV